jgi:hypothetical protein
MRTSFLKVRTADSKAKTQKRKVRFAISLSRFATFDVATIEFRCMHQFSPFCHF